MSEGDGTRVLEEDILRLARGARQSTRGGVQQITPQVLKIAIEASINGSCAWVIASLSDRISRGDFNSSIGRLQCFAWTAALWKNPEKTDIRPISCGDALRKLMVKAHSDQAREELFDHVGKRQWES